MKTILVIRLSAMGDVAMSVPVIKAFSKQYTDVRILFLTRKAFNPFFMGIDNLHLINPDLNGEHKGTIGLFKLFRQINKEYHPETIIDIHNVLRSKILRVFFKLIGVPVFVINKGRIEKRKLTKKKNKVLKPLTHSSVRYAQVFKKADYPLQLDKKKYKLYPEITDKVAGYINSDTKNIGIAPFAMHLQKQYPIERTKELINILAKKGFKVYIFGGGKKEAEIAENLAKNQNNIESLIGKFSLQEEIAFISRLNLMISMDSANMHIAALTGIDIVSIWGATHPFAGFTPFIPDEKSHIVQRTNLACRPCSVFGSKACYKNTMECFDIPASKIAALCEKIINS